MTLKNINNTVKEMSDKIDRLKKDISESILSLPDNPRINRLSDNCFTINLSDIQTSQLCDTGLILSPFYHNFKSQYKKIIEIIESSKPEAITPTLEKIIKPSKFGHWYRQGGGNYRFHPEVIEHLKSIL